MPDSLRELIIKHIKTTLEGITTGNGYKNTMQSVQRFRQSGQTQLNVPYALIIEDTEEAEDGPDPVIVKKLNVVLWISTRQDEAADARSGDEVMNTLREDVERAMMVDRQRGGHAIDTKPVSSVDLNVEPGQPGLETEMTFAIHYRHRNTDPTVKL